jgi:hypothetical protein
MEWGVMMADVYGQQEMASDNNQQNQLAFVIKRALSKLKTSTLVQVDPNWVAPTGVGPVGFVNVIPLVGQVDGSGVIWPATTIYGVPYLRIQGGANAVIVDPQPGDVGMICTADSDISSVKATGAAAGPASKRKFDLSDAIYFGGWNMGITPTSYMHVTQSSIDIVNPTQVNLQVAGGASAVLTEPGMKINGTLEVTGATTLDQQCEVKGLLLADANVSVGGQMNDGGSGAGLVITVPINSQSSINATGVISGSDFNGGTHYFNDHTHLAQGSNSTTTAPNGG